MALVVWMVMGLGASAQAQYSIIYSLYSGSREDNFATTNPTWAGRIGDRKSPDYRLYRIEGMMFSAEGPQPAGTVPVYSWYSPVRGDNFMTSDPRWRGERGDRKSPDYTFVRMEGYVYDPNRPQPQGTVALYSWYNPDRGDNFITTDRHYAATKGADNKGPNYRFVRREGYVLPRVISDSGFVPTVTIPVHFHFLHSTTDSTTGLPGFDTTVTRDDGSRVTQTITMLDLDQALSDMNSQLDAARGVDSRRLTFVRSGMNYIPFEETDDLETVRPINAWWSGRRQDNFATTNPAWVIEGTEGEQKSPDYKPAGRLGVLYRADRPQPAGTIPVYHWYRHETGGVIRADNLITSDPAWAGVRGDSRDGYDFIRIEGYIYRPDRAQPRGTVELHRWYNEDRHDSIVKSDHYWYGEPGDERDGYVHVRHEGYVALPAGCDSLGSQASAFYKPNAINVVVTDKCGGVAISPDIIRATTGSLSHELGHAMGQFHMFEGNKSLSTVEILHRNLDPTNEKSCYRLGDRVCDTPPDYGFADAAGNRNPQCDENGGVPIACIQMGPVCDASEPMVDGAGLCVNRDGQGRRTYNSVTLGLQLGTPNNIMAYHNQDEFSYEQFLRMLNYGFWRTGQKNLVPHDEKYVFYDFWPSVNVSTFWSTNPDQYTRLSHAKFITQPSMQYVAGDNYWREVVTSSVGDKLLNFRVKISGTGTLGDAVQLGIRFPDGRSRVFTNDFLKISGGTLTFDEIYGADLAPYRGRQAYGEWQVRLLNVTDYTPTRAELYVIGE